MYANVAFIAAKGATRAAAASMKLPLSFFCRLVPPVKDARLKVVVEANRKPIPLDEVFRDLVGRVPVLEKQSVLASAAVAVGLQLRRCLG